MAILKEERIGGQRLILGDCMEVMPLLGDFDAVVTDPPYGIGMSGGNVGYKGANNFTRKEWDAEPAADAVQYISELGCPYIIWGGNYFALPPSRCYLVWDKGAGFRGRSYAESEIAWTNIDANARTLTRDPLAKGDYKGKMHPTQKPTPLMEWCLVFLPDAKTILDPFMGSGSTLIACHTQGRKGTGIERDPEYFDIACKRLDEAMRQPDMFAAAPAPLPAPQTGDLF